MIETLKRHPKAALFSLILHVLVIGLPMLVLSGEPVKPVVSKQGPVTQTIKAEVIDQKQLDERADAIKKQQEQKIKQTEQQKKLAAEQKKKKELDAQNRKKEQLKKAEAEKQKKADIAAKKQKADLTRKKEIETAKKAQAEKNRKDAEIRKAEAEKKKIEDARKEAVAEEKRIEEARIKAEAEKKRQQEEAERLALEAERKAEKDRLLKELAEQRQKEAELKAQLAAEERQRELDSLRNKYHSLIRQKITRNWRQPANAGNKPLCEVQVVQGPGGIILDVTFGSCPGTREYRLSVEAAVLKSDPLPAPEDPSLFERNLNLQFKP